MIRFSGLRPKGVPLWLGLGSENAAHRIAVEWEQDGEIKDGVFIPQRNSNSWFNRTLGGRVFPGLFQKSRFEVEETAGKITISIGGKEIFFRGKASEAPCATSLFKSVEEAAGFFALGATGYSTAKTAGHFEGMELRCLDWSIAPMEIEEARVAYYEDASRFPLGTVELDSALLMRATEHEWHSKPDLVAY